MNFLKAGAYTFLAFTKILKISNKKKERGEYHAKRIKRNDI